MKIAAKNFQSVENDREKFYFQFFTLARAINSLNSTSRVQKSSTLGSYF